MRLLATMEYGPYLPDQPDLGNPGMELARNVLPRVRGYDSMPELTVYSVNGLPSRALGAFSAKDANNTSYVFGGTATQLWQLTSAQWNDASRTPAYTATDRWEFTKFKNTVIAASKENRMQTVILGGPTFDDLITEDIFGKSIATVRSFVVIGNVNDSDGNNQFRVRWSPLDNPGGDWTPDPATRAGFQDLPSVGGQVLRVIGGEFGMVFRERAVHRMTFVSGQVSWQFDEVDSGIGTLAAGSVVQHGGQTFFWAEDGVRVTQGDASVAVGEEAVDISLLADLDQTYLERITGDVYTDEQIIVWSYPGPGNIGGQPNRLLIYNYGTQRFASGDEAVDILFRAATPFRSIDGFDDDPAYGGTQSPPLYSSVDDIPGSLDDTIWAGGAFQLGAIIDGGALALYNGPPKAAQFETAERQFVPGHRSLVTEMRSLANAAGRVEVEIGSRASQRDPVVWSQAYQPTPEGFIPTRVDGRYLRFRTTLRDGFADAVGLEVYGEPTGGR